MSAGHPSISDEDFISIASQNPELALAAAAVALQNMPPNNKIDPGLRAAAMEAAASRNNVPLGSHGNPSSLGAPPQFDPSYGGGAPDSVAFHQKPPPESNPVRSYEGHPGPSHGHSAGGERQRPRWNVPDNPDQR